LSNPRAPRPPRLPHPKLTTINPKDSRYERRTTGGAGQPTLLRPCRQPVEKTQDRGGMHMLARAK
jgi:hypothetical protein